MDHITEELKNTRVLNEFLYADAKLFWGLGMLLKILGAGLGIIFIIINFSSSITSVLVLISALLSEILQWQSDTLKGQAENLKRKLEYADGLGWKISKEDLSDLFAGVSEKTRLSIEEHKKEDYFASEEPPGPKRLLQNLQESAWWSKYLSKKMIWYYGVFSACLILGSFIVFMISISTSEDFNQLQIINRIIISIVSLTLSIGISKLIIGYIKFNRRAENTEKSANQLLKSNQILELDVIRLLHEYQISRATAPFIPTLIWQLHRNSLNELWTKFRK